MRGAKGAGAGGGKRVGTKKREIDPSRQVGSSLSEGGAFLFGASGGADGDRSQGRTKGITSIKRKTFF